MYVVCLARVWLTFSDLYLRTQKIVFVGFGKCIASLKVRSDLTWLWFSHFFIFWFKLKNGKALTDVATGTTCRVVKSMWFETHAACSLKKKKKNRIDNVFCSLFIKMQTINEIQRGWIASPVCVWFMSDTYNYRHFVNVWYPHFLSPFSCLTQTVSGHGTTGPNHSLVTHVTLKLSHKTWGWVFHDVCSHCRSVYKPVSAANFWTNGSMYHSMCLYVHSTSSSW